MIYPDDAAPTLILPTVGGGDFDLSASNPEKFTVLVFYRGKHCPLCVNYLQEIEEHATAIKDAGLDLAAISMDDEERAADFTSAVAKKVNKSALSFPVAYGLTEEQAREWGLFISSAREGSMEPAVFSEPGLFAVRPNKTIFMVQTQSAPFTRPSIEQLIGGLSYAYQHKYPTRGNLTKK